MKKLKQKLRDRERICGMHVCLTEPSISEMCGGLGYDFLWIDTEHTAIDYQTLLYHLMGAKAGGTETLVRIPWNDPIMAKRVLEMGPDGIIIPTVNTAEELDAAMRATLYPPYGIRGFGPIRAVRYGLEDANTYIEASREDMVRCVQIESKQAVENLRDMAKNPYVDCFIFGPCDLSGSIGELNQVFQEHTSSLIDEAVSILKEAGKSIGISTGSSDPEVLTYWHEKGINVISAGSDYVHIMEGAQRELKTIREIQCAGE
ncbi:MAG: aldolase [Lachnospiraceae bacterium]|jgi:4-hydroxy-2-oxoheptanedioate aldolase|nr:aldolase [Lachnospiraceae bacterium]MCI8995517.1 aldolase [Lachnospiraceae bacterium]